MISELLLLQKFLLIAMAIPLVDIGLKFTKNRTKLATGKLGSIKDMGKLRGTDGLILSKKFQLNFKKVMEGVVIIAPTGEHKSTSIMIPNLLNNEFPKCSLICADPKGELYRITKDYQRSIGREPILFEPLGNNSHYNPLENCEDFTEVRELASSLIQNGGLALQLATGKSGGGDSFFENSCIPIFTAALLHSKTIPEAVKFLINTPILKMIEILGMNTNEDIKTQFNIFMASAESPKTMSSIMSTLLTNLQLFTDHKIINTLSSSDFKPLDLRDRPITLYIKYDATKGDYLSPFLSVFYSQLINKIMYGKGLPVLFFLDEFQNIGRLNNFAQTVAVSRSENIGFIVCLQNLVKIHDIYGKNNAKTILNNLKTKCILPSISDDEALTYISNLADDTEIPTESISENRITHSKTTRKLITQGEVRRLEDDEILIIAHNKNAFKDKQNVYYSEEGDPKTIYERRLEALK